MARPAKSSKSQTQPQAQAQTRSHSHSHGSHNGHSHSHDNSYLTSTNKSDAGVRITRIGLYVNLGMALSKGLGGYYFNSKALLADALHSLTDLVSDIMTLATVSWSLKPPSERFPAGYGKIESLGSLGVSGILLASGALMGWAAMVQLAQQFAPGVAEVVEMMGLAGLGHGHSHGGGHDDGVVDAGPNINAMWLAAGSIAIKEWLYRATLKVARARKSSVLASNAYHHRVDSLTALVALLLIGGSNVLSNASWLDPVGGLVISLMIIQAGWGNTLDALLELADVGVEKGMREKVRTQAMRALEESLNSSSTSGNQQHITPPKIRSVSGVKAGQNYLMDLELVVPGGLSVHETQDIERKVRDRVGVKVRGVKRVRVRFVPADGDVDGDRDAFDEFVGADVSPRSSPEPEEEEASNGHARKH